MMPRRVNLPSPVTVGEGAAGPSSEARHWSPQRKQGILFRAGSASDQTNLGGARCRSRLVVDPPTWEIDAIRAGGLIPPVRALAYARG